MAAVGRRPPARATTAMRASAGTTCAWMETGLPAGTARGIELVSVERDLMGGRVGIHLGVANDDGGADSSAVGAQAAAARTLSRIEAWARRLTRFSEDSDLAIFNRDPRRDVQVRPTFAAALAWGREASVLTGGVVDITLLRDRLAAELGAAGESSRRVADSIADRRERPIVAEERSHHEWHIERGARRSVVSRAPGLGFDLDGVAKGWLADRALDLLGGYPLAVVDADGDIAVRLAPGQALAVAVGHPLQPLDAVAHLDLESTAPWGARFGVATSGTSVHRWQREGRIAHHLIDPATHRPAVSDVVQATVLASTAREAEAWAKTAVILGSAAALRAFDMPGVGLILVTEGGELLATMEALRWLR